MVRERLEPAGHWTWRGGPAWGPIAQGWRVGNMVFVGGQVAVDERGQVIAPGDIETQTRECYQNIQKVLEPNPPANPPRFPTLSATEQKLAPGRYVFWAGTRAQSADRSTIAVGNGETETRIELLVR